MAQVQHPWPATAPAGAAAPQVLMAAALLPHGVPLEVEVGTGKNWLQAH
ncbi:hypothetical protein [Hymenobacter rubripertinctus]|nr:hypothetical protein [Hymenobacter rubripertinctus]